MTAPHAQTGDEVAQAIGAVLHRPSWLRVPEAVVKLGMGDAAEIVTTGQRVYPRRAEELGTSSATPASCPRSSRSSAAERPGAGRASAALRQGAGRAPAAVSSARAGAGSWAPWYGAQLLRTRDKSRRWRAEKSTCVEQRTIGSPDGGFQRSPKRSVASMLHVASRSETLSG